MEMKGIAAESAADGLIMADLLKGAFIPCRLSACLSLHGVRHDYLIGCPGARSCLRGNLYQDFE